MAHSFIKRPEIAELTDKIVAILIAVNDELSDASLSRSVGENVTPATYALKAALRDLERADPPVLFRRIRTYGWKRMSDEDVVAHSDGDVTKLKRGARRSGKRLRRGVVNFAGLPNKSQIHAAINATLFSTIEQAASKVVKRKSTEPSNIPDLATVIAKIKGEQVA